VKDVYGHSSAAFRNAQGFPEGRRRRLVFGDKFKCRIGIEMKARVASHTNRFKDNLANGRHVPWRHVKKNPL